MNANEEAAGAGFQNRAEYAATVLQQLIPWHAHFRGATLELIKAFDEATPEQRLQQLRGPSGPAIVRELVRGLGTIKDRTVVQYLLTLIQAALEADPRSSEHFWTLLRHPVLLQEPAPAEEAKQGGPPAAMLPSPFRCLLSIVQDDANPYNVETAQEALLSLFGTPQDEYEPEDEDLEELQQFLGLLVARLKAAAKTVKPLLQQQPQQQPPQSAQQPVSPSSAYVISPSPSGGSGHGLGSPMAGASPAAAPVIEVSPRLLQALTGLKRLLKSRVTHQAFVELGGLQALVELLTPALQGQTQLLYETGFALWLLSYNPRMHERFKEQRMLSRFASVLLSVKEKVVRIVFCVLRNLGSSENDAVLEDMVGAGLIGIVEALQQRQWKDKELVASLGWLQSALAKVLDRLSSFDLYQAELSSGQLRWGPVHTEKFWRDHARQFEADNFELVRNVVELLGSEDLETLEVAAYDIGQFAVHYPDGRRLCRKWNAKEKLMMMMTHRNDRVAKQSLLSMQKLLINDWKALSNSQNNNSSSSSSGGSSATTAGW